MYLTILLFFILLPVLKPNMRSIKEDRPDDEGNTQL
jgi:hypothetical protein